MNINGSVAQWKSNSLLGLYSVLPRSCRLVVRPHSESQKLKKNNMKKAMLIVVSLLLTLFSYSQDFNRVINITKSRWDGEQWKVVSSNQPTDMFVIIDEWNITIGSYKFRTYDTPEKTTYDTHVCYSWKCIDKDGDKCMFLMKKFKPEVSTHMLYGILYQEDMIMYEYETIQ